jgi:hypothetical protein
MKADPASMKASGQGRTGRPWIGRWRGQVLVIDSWMCRSDAPRMETINLDLSRAQRLEQHTFQSDDVREVDDPAEYRAELRRYEAWLEGRDARVGELAAREESMRAVKRESAFRPLLPDPPAAPFPADPSARESAAPPRPAAPSGPAVSPAARLAAERERYGEAAELAGALLYRLAAAGGEERRLLRLSGMDEDAGFDAAAGDVVRVDGAGAVGEPRCEGAEWESAVQALRDWQRERRVARARAELLASLDEWTSQLHDFPYAVDAREEWLRPSTGDIDLALRWCQSPHAEDLRRRRQEEGGTEPLRQALARHFTAGRGVVPESFHELARNLSARLAERVVRRCAEAAGARVHDVAAEQIQAPGWLPSEYDRCDLRVQWSGGARYVDVKNGRHSHSPGAVELCIPKFKHTRGTGEGVLIGGVVSPYRNLGQLLEGEYLEGETPTVLGLLSEPALERIRRAAGTDARVEIDVEEVESRGRKRHLAPWTFEFPAAAYAGRRQLLRRVRRTMDAHPDVWADAEQSPWPLFIAAGGVERFPERVASLPAPWDGWVRACARLPRTPSLPLLYVALVEHFFSSLLRGIGAGLTVAELRDRLYPRYDEFLYGGGERQAPLGIADPTESIRRLVATLRSLMDAALPRLVRFDRFRFRRTGEVAGRLRRTRRWRTLVFPYCGNPRCRERELALGKEGIRNCARCGKLVCPDPACGFCSPSEGCERARRLPRRLAWLACHRSARAQAPSGRVRPPVPHWSDLPF